MSRWGELIPHQEGEACQCGCQDQCGYEWYCQTAAGREMAYCTRPVGHTGKHEEVLEWSE